MYHLSDHPPSIKFALSPAALPSLQSRQKRNVLLAALAVVAVVQLFGSARHGAPGGRHDPDGGARSVAYILSSAALGASLWLRAAVRMLSSQTQRWKQFADLIAEGCRTSTCPRVICFIDFAFSPQP